ncbi:MAG: isochorismatase family cysteine hydrolase [Acutalibacteraceae bacterium]|nr:isochorismatase family cysteine hydrolase [Acutalibacteraceae bacterium]
MIKAILVMDMQNVCVGKNQSPYFKYDRDNIVSAVNNVIENNQDNLVIYIKNIMKRNFINKFAPFQAYEGTEEVEFAEDLKIVSDYVFEKYTGDAFSNVELREFLSNKKVDVVEIVGVDGGGCVSLTAIGAVKNGYKVIMNTKAIGTIFEKNKNKYFNKLKNLGAEFI